MKFKFIEWDKNGSVDWHLDPRQRQLDPRARPKLNVPRKVVHFEHPGFPRVSEIRTHTGKYEPTKWGHAVTYCRQQVELRIAKRFVTNIAGRVTCPDCRFAMAVHTEKAMTAPEPMSPMEEMLNTVNVSFIHLRTTPHRRARGQRADKAPTLDYGQIEFRALVKPSNFGISYLGRCWPIR